MGCVKVFHEELSSVATKRPQLDAALDYVREGDTLIVTKPDRLARSTLDLLQIAKGLEGNGVTLRILSLDLNTATPTGKLMLTVLGGIAAFERDLMLERQREGIAKAKADGKYKGRSSTSAANPTAPSTRQCPGCLDPHLVGRSPACSLECLR